MLTFEGEVGIGATGIGDKHRALRMWFCRPGEGYFRRGVVRKWYGVFIVRYRARITMSVELAVPIHHGSDGEAAGESGGL